MIYRKKIISKPWFTAQIRSTLWYAMQSNTAHFIVFLMVLRLAVNWVRLAIQDLVQVPCTWREAELCNRVVWRGGTTHTTRRPSRHAKSVHTELESSGRGYTPNARPSRWHARPLRSHADFLKYCELKLNTTMFRITRDTRQSLKHGTICTVIVILHV